MPKIIAAYFDEPGFDSYPFNKDSYRRAYKQLADLLAERGGTLAIVRGQETYGGGNTFSEGWICEGKTFQQIRPLTANVLFNRGNLKADADALVVEEPALDHLCTDKSVTYAMFPALFPKTIVVHSAEEVPAALDALTTDQIVAKPLDQEEGKGVIIGTKEAVARSLPFFPYLLQEFLDTSGGIAGICEGMHDFRIITIRGAVIAANITTPMPGSLVVNEACGGVQHDVPLEKIPSEALALFREVDASLHHFPNRVYCVDMGRDQGGRWKLIELNAKPGLDPLERDAGSARYLRGLADLLVSV
ncbi:MAG: hypothetical protein PHI23_00940 [Candidatus Peribacteraceae bacterium]|nr:hypothetical protein [Candidatus Peribacteraceae bacterium]